MADLEITRYTPDLHPAWDDFIRRSKNGTFLLMRDYMDYHATRFEDHSLVFSKGGSIQAVMPACRCGEVLVSHAGLTYGGFIMSRKTSAEDTLKFFLMLAGMLRKEGFGELRIKPVPHIYHTQPAEEDLYAMFRLNASLTVRNISAAICRPDPIIFRKDRKAGARRAAAAGVTVCQSSDYPAFWEILRRNLAEKYGATPVHSLEEITRLASAFPDNIKLFLAMDSGGSPIGGTVLYISGDVVHTQYISATSEGKRSGAIDLIFQHLVNTTFSDVRYFDFGTSNEDGGRVLNESLICQKEGFGARAICYDTYSIKL